MKGFKTLKKTEKEGIYCSGGMGGSTYTEFEVGKTYELNGDPELCKNGYHFWEHFCFGIEYYENAENVYVEIEALGNVIKDTEKCVTNVIKIIRIIHEEEWLNWVDGNNNSGYRNLGYMNSGNRNSGDKNSGDWNSGYKNSGNINSGDKNSGNMNSGYNNSGDKNSGNNNSGDKNSGYNNSGDWNSGDWNSGDWNSGYFNIDTPKKIKVFGKVCLKIDWEEAAKPNFLFFTLEEDYKESFIKSLEKARSLNDWPEQLKLLLSLPNFDYNIFEEISGISKEMLEEEE